MTLNGVTETTGYDRPVCHSLSNLEFARDFWLETIFFRVLLLFLFSSSFFFNLAAPSSGLAASPAKVGQKTTEMIFQISASLF